MDSSLTPWIFASIMTVGVIYMLVSLIFGEVVDFADLDLDFDGDIDTSAAGEGMNIGCASIAAFLASFGAMGLVGSLAGVALLGTLVGAGIFGLLIGRLVIAALAYLKQQESTRITSESALIGMNARVTINSPAGKAGEVMVEGEHLMKYPVKEMNQAALHRGDTVHIVDISGGYLIVQREAEPIRTQDSERG